MNATTSFSDSDPSSSKLARKTVFFLGSGASVYAGIPAVKPMTDKFLKYVEGLPYEQKHAITSICDRLKENQDGEPDIEGILDALHTLETLESKPVRRFVRPDHGLDPKCVETVRIVLENFVRREVSRPKNLEYLDPLFDP